MSAPIITVEPLTSEAFASYGDVIETDGNACFPINAGRADRYDALCSVDCEGSKNGAVISLVKARRYDFPKTVTFLERHPFGSQAFIPAGEAPFLVVVAVPGGTVDESTLKAFLTNGKQGINYHRNTWHHVMLTPFEDVTFIVVDRSDPETNCEEHWYAEEDQPVLDSGGLF